MSNVAVEKHTLDVLATAISNKSGVPLTLTLTEMVDAVDSIQTGGGGGQPSLQTKAVTYTPTTSQQTATITADSGYDGLEEVDVTVNAVPIMSQYSGDISQYFHTENNQRKWSVEGIIRTDYGGMVNAGASFGTGSFTYNAVPANTVITPTSQAQTVGGANWMMEGAITINPASGGSSSWTKVSETTYNVNTTSTSAYTVATWSTGNRSIWTSNSYVLIRIRDTAGARAGYFYGSDTFVANQILANGQTTTSLSLATRYIYRYTSSSQYVTATSSYGVYPDYIYSDGSIRIRARYGSSTTLTIDGTFSVAVYLLTPPSAIFE